MAPEPEEPIVPTTRVLPPGRSSAMRSLDPSGLPMPRALPGRISVAGRLALPRERQRQLTAPLDAVTFTARCPACGQDCQWSQERVDTRLRTTIDCPCSEDPRAHRPLRPRAEVTRTSRSGAPP
jgi:hypothetical protein